MCIVSNKEKVEQLFNELNTKYTLGYHLIYSKTVHALGSCNWGNRVIKISSKYLETCSWAIIEDVVRHEIAHAIDAQRRGYSKHDYTWKRICLEVGADPTRTTAVPKDMKPQKKYIKSCVDCGDRGQVSRATKNYTQGRYFCSDCYPTKKNRITIRLNPKY